MGTHCVIMRQSSEQTVSVEIEFIIQESGKKLGESHESKESLEWLPSNSQYKRRMSWSKFAKITQEEKKVR